MQALIAFLLCFILCACQKESDHKNIIKFATSGDYPPYEFFENGTLKGFDIDLARLVADEMGMEAHFENMQFSSLFKALQTDHVDAAISTIAATKERSVEFDFTIPYAHEKIVALFHASHPLASDRDLVGKKVAAQLGSTMEIWAKKNISNVRIMAVNQNNHGVEALKAHHVDAVLLDHVQGVMFKQQNPGLQVQTMADAPDGFCIALQKSSPYTQKINVILEKLKKSGQLDGLKKKWMTPQKIESSPIKNFIHQVKGIGKGALLTLQLMFGSFLLGLLLAVVISILRHQKKGVWILDRIISLLRGTPLILQLCLVYYVFPAATGIKLSVLATGVLTFGINSAAYVAEILRGGIESLPKGQFEAAKTLQIPSFYMWLDIILPQVIKNVFPSLVNELVSLLKETAVISMIGGMDIMRHADFLAAETFNYFLPLCIAGAYYYFFVVLIETLGNYFVKRNGSC
ncbi:MAG: Membrane-bound lytic murein transglycosylase F [Holosporales bacterium]